MSGTIAYNYVAVDSSSLSMQNITNAIEANNSQLRSLTNALNGCFTGPAADEGWKPKIQVLQTKIETYQAELVKLRNAVVTACGQGGYMHITDKQQGARFLAVKV